MELKRVHDSLTFEDDIDVLLHGTKLDLLLSKPSRHDMGHRRSVSLTSKASSIVFSKTPRILPTPTLPKLNVGQKPTISPGNPICMPQYQPIHNLYQALPSVSYVQHGPYSTSIESPLTSEIFDYPSTFNYPSMTSRTSSPPVPRRPQCYTDIHV